MMHEGVDRSRSYLLRVTTRRPI